MQTFTYVEDYLELLAGFDPGQHLVFNSSQYKFSLARYDVNIVASMADSTLWSQAALTEKQGELAVKLVIKYRKQFASNGIDVTPVENPVFRKPLRVVDKSRRIYLQDDQIILQFPYDKMMIEDVQKFKAISQGKAKFNTEFKQWRIAYTEYNLNWVIAWGQTYKFEIADELLKMFDRMLAVEDTPYGMKLVQTQDGFDVLNAPNSMKTYIEERLGGFGADNAMTLLDYAGVLGYDIDATVTRPALLDIAPTHETYIKPSQEALNMVLEYAALANRWPVCIYNPGMQEYDLTGIAEQDIIRFDRNGKTATSDYNPHCVKVIYAQKLPKHWQFPVPLLLTTVQMMFGANRTLSLIHI